MSTLLKTTNLRVSIGKKRILKGIDIDIHENTVYALFGPNGSGKSTLMNALIGMPGLNVDGSITFAGKDITGIGIDERAKMGLNISFQNAPVIRGVTLKDMINICRKRKPGQDLTDDELDMVKRFKLEAFLERDINLGFSGGEKKRADILQLLMMQPKLLLLDEPDSGVDIESLKLISREIAYYIRESHASALIITHQGQMMEYITTKEACVLLEGKIHCYLEPAKILEDIKEKGYVGCIDCEKK